MPGDHVTILGPTSRQLVTAIDAVWLPVAHIVVLPLPMRLSSIEEFVAQTRARILHADARLVIIYPDQAHSVVPQPGDPPMHGWGALQPVAGPQPAADWW